MLFRSIEVPYGDAQLVQQKQTSQNIVDNRAAINIIAVDDENEAAAETAIRHFRTLGKLFNKEALAEQKLAELDASFAQMRQRIRHYYSEPLSVLVMRFSTPNTVFLATETSTTDYVVRKLALKEI